MRARLVVFPVKGRNWCFTRSLDSVSGPESSSPSPALKDLWRKISTHGRPAQEKAEIVADFVADKMNRAWIGLEKAPAGTFKSKIHSLGLRLLSRVKPSEIFLKSVTKDITEVEITYPSSLNPRLVRRRVRHIAMRGAAIHKRYFYGSVALLPFTTVLAVLPLPNIPFFWILFRAYSHWRALKGSERLLLLVSDCSRSWNLLRGSGKENGSMEDSNHSPDNGRSNHSPDSAPESPWVLKPSDDLERLVQRDTEDGCVSCCTISSISKEYDLNKKDILKFKDFQ
ncbi:uncharacterized protein C23H3.12c isoform X2 [Elaeis guineensis]|uniref:Uncharacterized protein LOC105041963 isoform X2 n=1 Tax=Elaeis guineensis var. tenera TaxID=51953 RepID=A0A6I9QYS6_ELAGV|nr:uncharacterized protein LOC105041963 isoform X2 [Elaeis guineensis]